MNPYWTKLISVAVAAALVVIAVLLRNDRAAELLYALAGLVSGGALIPRPGDAPREIQK